MARDNDKLGRSAYHKKWREDNIEYKKEKHRKYYRAHKEKIKDKNRQWLLNNPEKRKMHNKTYYKKHREWARAYQRAKVKSLREAVFAKLGHRCVCCGEDQYEFLAIDHIKGGGRLERKKIGNKGIFRKIINQPDSGKYQILCHNCNSAKGFYGACPHKTFLKTIGILS